MKNKLKANTRDPEMEKIMRALMQWHQERVQQLKELIAIGDDVEITVAGADGSKTNLSGQHRTGFKVGANAALSLFENFPLKIVGGA